MNTLSIEQVKTPRLARKSQNTFANTLLLCSGLLFGAMSVSKAETIGVGSGTTGTTPWTIAVAANGQHPSGGSFDGFRIYLLPIETTTVNAPDIVIRIVDQNGMRWASSPDGETPCPDAPSCRFEVDLHYDEPFALIILDSDPWLNQVLAAVEDVNALIDELLGKVDKLADRVTLPESLSQNLQQWHRALPTQQQVYNQLGIWTDQLPIAKEEIRDLIGFLNPERETAYGNTRRFVPGTHDLIDVIVLVPEAGADRQGIALLQERVRLEIDRIAGTVLGNAERRVSGQLRKEYMTDCTMIACDLTYSTVHFTME